MSSIFEVTIEELHEISILTIHLTKLRQNECKDQCIENFAPKLFHELLSIFVDLKKNGHVRFGMFCCKLDKNGHVIENNRNK